MRWLAMAGLPAALLVGLAGAFTPQSKSDAKGYEYFHVGAKERRPLGLDIRWRQATLTDEATCIRAYAYGGER